MASKVTATAWGPGDIEIASGIPVVNPGEWFGQAWLLHVESSYFVVEADSLGGAEDILAEDEEHGKAIRIDAEVEGGDYGYAVSPGDRVGGLEIEQKGWVNLKGEFIVDPARGKYLTDPQVSGNGTPYDSQMVGAWSDVKIRYYGGDLPEDGLTPEEHSQDRTECDECDKVIWACRAVLDRFRTFCSHECRDLYNKDDDDDAASEAQGEQPPVQRQPRPGLPVQDAGQ